MGRHLPSVVSDCRRQWTPATCPAATTTTLCIKSLLAGLLSGIAYRSDVHEYTGAGGNRLHIWPGSGLFAQRPKWIVAAELVETNRRYCRVVARINPNWIEPLAAHLVKRSHSEPHWDRRSGSAMALERVSLFGLPIVPRRRVPLGPVDPDAARQLFIQHAMVEEEIAGRFEFLDHNRRVLQEIEELAAKERRGDWIVGQQTIFEYYERQLPPDVYDVRRLKQWLTKQHRNNSASLCMCRADLLSVAESAGRFGQFPRSPWSLPRHRSPWTIASPGDEDQDGVIVTVPKHAINQISHAQIDWLVPGRLEEKITALIRSLPKSIRRCLVPAPDTARRAAEQLPFGAGPFLPQLAQVLERLSGETVPPDAFQLDRIPSHLRMKVRVVDDDGTTLAVNDSLDLLQNTFGAPTDGPTGQIDDSAWNRPPVSDWDFGELPTEVTVTRSGFRVSAYPAVIEQQDAVVVRLLDTLDRAQYESRRGIRRLYYLAEARSLLAHVAWIPQLDQIKLLASTLISSGELDTQLALLIADRAFLGRASIATQPGRSIGNG